MYNMEQNDIFEGAPMRETKLKERRKELKMKLREVAEIVGVTTSTVHDMEVHGLRTPRAAMKYAAAFPKTTWMDLIEINTPAPAGKQ